MPTRHKHRRGNEAQRSGITPLDGELILTEDENKLYRGDGSTAGGIPLAYADQENGFENRTDSTLSFVDGTRTFTIAPAVTSFSYYHNGVPYTKTSAENIVIPDTEGLHYIYYDGSTLSQTTSFTPAIITTYAFIIAIYWDATNNTAILLGDERHGAEMDAGTHSYLHNTAGAQYDSGLGIGNMDTDGSGNDASAAQLSVADGSFWDEDIEHTITGGSPQTLSPIAQLPVYYLDGASENWRKVAATNYPVHHAVAGRPYWNEWTGTVWQLTETTANYFTLSHIFASNDINEPVIVIMGQAEYAGLNDARAGAETELRALAFGNLASLSPEFIPVGTIIWETKTTYSNAVKARTRTVNVAGDDYIDWRTARSGGASSGTSTTDHGGLTGLGDDDHTQYHNDARGDARYLQLTGGSLTGALTINVGNIASLTIDNSTTAADPWDFIQGWPGNYDGYLAITTNGTGALASAQILLPPSGAPVFANGVAVVDGQSFKSNSSGSLAFWKPYDGTRSVLSFRGANNSTGKFRIQGNDHTPGSWSTHTIIELEAINAGSTVDIFADVDIDSTLAVDTINEHTATSGVTVDGVLLKDGEVDGFDVGAKGGNWDTAYTHSQAAHAPSDADNTAANETSHADVLVDGDFSSNGLMKRTGAGTYAIVTDNSSNWDTAFGWGDHAGLYAASGHTHGQLHDRSHAMTGTSDHTATAWRLFYSNASGDVTELAFGTSGQVLQSNGATSAPSFANTSGGGLTTTAVKNANYTASAGERVPCDTGGGAFTLTFPASPSAGDQVGGIDIDGDFSTNNLTLGRNGSNIMGLAEDMTVDIDYCSFVFEYIDATRGWVLL